MSVEQRTLEYAGAETYECVIEGEVTRHYYDCPACGFPLCEWMDCPECGWYDESAWEQTLQDGDRR
jgi:hypothetical protein